MTPYNGGYSQKRAYGQYGTVYDKNGKPNGSYGNPNTQYHGPGMRYLVGAQKQLQTRYNPVLGQGIVLGKYSTTSGGDKRIVDYDEVELAGPDSQMYKDAYDLALRSGRGETDIQFPIDYIPEAEAAKIHEDIPDRTEFNKEIDVPSVEQASNKAY